MGMQSSHQGLLTRRAHQ